MSDILDLRALTGFAIVNNKPSILPPGFGETKYLQSWAADFSNSTAFDTFYCSSTMFYENGVGNNRSFVCSLRSQGDIWLSESFEASGVLSNYTKIETAGGVASVVDISDSDPAISGKALDLSTGGSVPSVAGVQRVLGAVGDNFSVQFQMKIIAGSQVSSDAVMVMLQNNAGAVLWTRHYLAASPANGKNECFIGGAWVNFLDHYGDFAEYWWDVVKVNSTQHKVTLLAGTQIIHEETGVLPSNTLGTNNMLYLSQQSGTFASRQCRFAQFNVGSTQLPDDLIVTSPKITVPHSPSVGHVYAILEDTSLNMLDGLGVLRTSMVKAFISKDDTAHYVEVPLEYMGDVGWGEVDNTKPLRLLRASVSFVAGSGTDLRMSLRTYNGGFFPVHAYELLWDYPT